jgi:DNA-binding MarR family transcriptional regulator
MSPVVNVDVDGLTDSDEILDYFRISLSAVTAKAMGEWLELDLSMPQLKALFFVTEHGPLSVGELASALGVGLPTGSHLVQRLVQAGLVERTEDMENRRRTLVHPSAEGEALVSRLRSGSRDKLRDYLVLLSEEERADLKRGLRALARLSTPNKSPLQMTTNDICEEVLV